MINEDSSVFIIKISLKRDFWCPVYVPHTVREFFDLINFFVVNY